MCAIQFLQTYMKETLAKEMETITLEPVGEGRRRGFRFRGALRVDRLIGGDALPSPTPDQETRMAVVAPTGFEPVFQP